MFVDYYKLLQVHPECDNSIIKRMRKVLATVYHPDIVAESEKQQCTQKMQLINAAIDFLTNKTKRQEYDAKHPYFSGSYGTSLVQVNHNNYTPTVEPNKRDFRSHSRQKSTRTYEYQYSEDFASNLRSYLKADILYKISNRARIKNLFTGFERKQYYNFAVRVKNNQEFTYWQKKNFSKYIVMAMKAGAI